MHEKNMFDFVLYIVRNDALHPSQQIFCHVGTFFCLLG